MIVVESSNTILRDNEIRTVSDSADADPICTHTEIPTTQTFSQICHAVNCHWWQRAWTVKWQYWWDLDNNAFWSLTDVQKTSQCIHGYGVQPILHTWGKHHFQVSWFDELLYESHAVFVLFSHCRPQTCKGLVKNIHVHRTQCWTTSEVVFYFLGQVFWKDCWSDDGPRLSPVPVWIECGGVAHISICPACPKLTAEIPFLPSETF